MMPNSDDRADAATATGTPGNIGTTYSAIASIARRRLGLIIDVIPTLH